MDMYMYTYNCKRWYGNVNGFKNLHVNTNIEDEKDVIKLAKKDANKFTGSKTCDVSLLQKFHVNIKPIKNYAALTSIPVSIQSNDIIDDDRYLTTES